MSSSGAMSPDTERHVPAAPCPAVAASAMRRAGYPSSPIARQNLMIVVPDVWARSAYSEIVHRAALPGSLTASRATRCSAGARLGISALMRTTTSTGASGSDTGVPCRADDELGRRAVADRLAAIAAPPSIHFRSDRPDLPAWQRRVQS